MEKNTLRRTSLTGREEKEHDRRTHNKDIKDPKDTEQENNKKKSTREKN